MKNLKVQLLALLLCASLAPAIAAAAPKPKKSGKAKQAKTKKAKGYDYDRSKYKAVIDAPPSQYRFDASGKPIAPAAAKGNKKGRPASAE